ncbi:hypothetical protein NMY22_g11105 [Coprinellus aureogranulatus]|nr:hypothetical protein NMY22_g11105 [Coprinellus aureogranulatus]
MDALAGVAQRTKSAGVADATRQMTLNAVRKKSRSLMIFAGILKYRMSPDIYSYLASVCLAREELVRVIASKPNPSHDDLLTFGPIPQGSATTGKSSSVRPSRSDSAFSPTLPGHKADRQFEGSKVLIQKLNTDDDPHSVFMKYLTSCDTIFPHNPELWLRADGSIPTRGWFIPNLRSFFPGNVGGHSLRSGGATALALAGIPPHIIQAIGRWAPNAFQAYIRKHPSILTAMVYHRTSHMA